MKKNLLYLLTLICTLSFFTACSDDDDDNNGNGTSTPVTGTWKLSYNQGIPVVYTSVSTGDAATDAELNTMIPAAIGGLMASKVTSVAAFLDEDASFDASWNPVNGSTSYLSELKMGDIDLSTFIKWGYTVVNNKMYITINKSAITMLQGAVASGVIPIDIDMQALLGIMEDLGDNYGLLINYTQEGDNTTFYLNKEQLAKALVLAEPLLDNIDNEVLAGLLPQLQAVLSASTTTKFDFGLVFNK